MPPPAESVMVSVALFVTRNTLPEASDARESVFPFRSYVVSSLITIVSATAVSALSCVFAASAGAQSKTSVRERHGRSLNRYFFILRSPPSQSGKMKGSLTLALRTLPSSKAP